MLFEQRLVVATSVLAAAVGVVDEPRRGAASQHRLVQRSDGQLSVE